MAQLVKSACKLHFYEHEFVEFFGEVSPLDEEACSFSYTATRDGMRLELTVFPIDGDIYVDIFREGISSSIVRSRLCDCSHSRIVWHGSVQCLEIGRPEIATTELSAPLDWGLRLMIDPNLKVEFIHERG